MESLSEYMKKELVFYIKQEYDKGIPLSKIKTSLLSGGHHKNLVAEALSSLKKNKYNLVKALSDPVKSNLDKELYFNIINSLVKYIEFQLSAGKSSEDVKKILSRYGHSDKIIKAAFSKVGKELPTVDNKVRILDMGVIVGFIIFLFVVAGLATEPLEIVLLGFLPCVLILAVSNILALRKVNKEALWALPFVFILIFIGLSFIPESVFTGMDIFKLSVFNLIFSLGYIEIKILRSKKLEDTFELLTEEVGLVEEEVDSEDESSSSEKVSKKSKSKK